MAVVQIATTSANNMLTALLADLDTGAGNCTIEFYAGTIPATPETAISSQTKLGTTTCSDPVGSVATKALTFSAITQDSSADATGTASFVRIKNPAGTAIIDADCSNTGGSGAVKLNTVSIVAGGPISVTSMVIRIP